MRIFYIMLIQIKSFDNRMKASIGHSGVEIEILYDREEVKLNAYLLTVLGKAMMAEDYIENPETEIIL